MEQIEIIAGKLTKSIQFIDIVEGELPKTVFYPLKIFDSTKSIGFRREANYVIQNCVDDILEINHPEYGPLFRSLDHEHVYDFLTKIASNAKQNAESNKYDLLLNELDEFIKNLKIFTFHSYVKIGNLKIAKQYDFNTFKLFPNDQELWRKLSEGKDEATQQKISKYFQKNSDVFLSIMELQVKALDENQAKTQTLQMTIDVLNIFRALGAIGVIREGENPLAFHDIYLINQNTGILHQSAQIENMGKLSIFDLDLFEKRNSIIIKKLQSCFDSNNASPLQIKMIKSLSWFGESICEFHPSQRLLKMIVSLETLLLDSNDRGSKSNLLKERAAFLLGKNYEVRNFVGDTVKEAYRVRNSIVHSGDKHPIPLRLIKRLLFVVHDLNMLFLVSGKYNSIEDIKIDVRDKKSKSMNNF
jgi:hypothetical protein